MYDESGLPLSGVRVIVLDKDCEVTTDRDGQFRLRVRGAADEPVTLRIDEGGGHVKEMAVTLGARGLGLKVKRRNP